MDFAGVLDTVSRFLDSRGFRYALVGAFALSAHGLSRATQDLDLAVDVEARSDLVTLFESLGYETLYCSEGSRIMSIRSRGWGASTASTLRSRRPRAYSRAPRPHRFSGEPYACPGQSTSRP